VFNFIVGADIFKAVVEIIFVVVEFIFIVFCFKVVVGDETL